MDLKGAEIRNIVNLCREMGSIDPKPLRVNVPHYQRPYKWDKERITNLVDDFSKNLIEHPSDSEYFVGSVVLVKRSLSGDGRLDVIDGQQRITTVFLMNYLKFLLLRAQAEDGINRRTSGSIGETLNQLRDCYVDLLGSSKKKSLLDQMKDEIVERIDALDEADASQVERTWSYLLARFQHTLGLPEKVFDKGYGAAYKSALYEFLSTDKLALKYSRSSYNRKLLEALSSIVLISDNTIRPKIDIEYAGNDPVVLQYTDALRYEFDALCKHAISSDSTPTQAAKSLIKHINKMIESIKFCVILTGSEKDAYTLFEVLNDRAMEVDDLDLIKNLFLREYCNKSQETEEQIDDTVGFVDSLWGEQIFKPDLAQSRAKTISFLGAIYLTADDAIDSKKTERYRSVIETKYFETHYQDKPYTSYDIKRDIFVYQMIGLLFDQFDIPAMKKDARAIKAEVDSSKSITYKTIHLLNAMDQIGVLAALVSLIVRTFMDMEKAENKHPLDAMAFRNYLNTLASSGSHATEGYALIHKWSFELWKASLLSSSYIVPRAISRKIINAVSSSKNDISSVYISADERSKMNDEFKNWSASWQYGPSTNMLKAKILFCELIRTSKTQDKRSLEYASISMSVNTDKIQLDHLDAKTPNDPFLDFYYKPADPNALRDKVINSLGNIMILDSDENNSKGNKPLEDALDYYSNMCPQGHWLIDEIRTDLEIEGNHRDVTIGNCKHKVPTDQFFSARGKQVREYFFALLSRKNVGDKYAQITAL